MSGHTAPPAPEIGVPEAEGLRERKKRRMRQQLSDTATAMFIERGFDAFRVSEVAEACEVSESTVFNYFPTKEALVLDRLDATTASLRTGLAEPRVSPVDAALRILDDELRAMTAWLANQEDWVQAATTMRRFGDLIDATPSLRAYQSDMLDQFIAVAAELLAERAGMSPDDPEPQIAATALLGLWRIQFQSLRKYLDGTRPPARVRQAVSADVKRAARLIRIVLISFGTLTPTRRRPPARVGPAEPNDKEALPSRTITDYEILSAAKDDAAVFQECLGEAAAQLDKPAAAGGD